MKKARTSDSSLAGLPKNRPDVFFDILKMRPGVLFALGSLLFLFALPHTLNTIFHNLQIDLIYEQIRLGKMNSEEGYQKISSLLVAGNFLNILFYMLIGFGFGGTLRILKRLIWAEGIIFWHDFKQSLKENSAQTTFLFLLIGIFSFILNYLGFVSEFAGGKIKDLYNLFRIISFGIALTVLLPVGGFVFSQIAYYNDSFFVRAKNGLFLLLKTGPRTLMFVLASLLPYVPLFIPHFIMQTLGRIIIIIFFLPLVVLAWMLYSNYVFDLYINSEHYPEIVDKGIWRS